MKTKLLAIIIPFFIMPANNYRISDTGYIKLEYSNEESKPYPITIFYLEGSIDTTTHDKFYINKIKINANDFDSILKIFNIKDVLSRTYNLTPPLEVTVVKNGKKEIILFRGKEIINEVFHNIITHFRNSDNEDKVKAPLIELLARLGMLMEMNIDKNYYGKRHRN